MELLSDPTNDRKVKAVKPPPHRPLSKELMWGKSKQYSRGIVWLFAARIDTEDTIYCQTKATTNNKFDKQTSCD